MNVYRFVSTPKKKGGGDSAWQIRCWMEPNFIIRKAQRQAGNICFPAVIYRNDKVLVNWMAAGGTLDCSTICRLLPLHKIPRHTAVKEAGSGPTSRATRACCASPAQQEAQCSGREFHVVFRMSRGGLTCNWPVCLFTNRYKGSSKSFCAFWILFVNNKWQLQLY